MTFKPISDYISQYMNNNPSSNGGGAQSNSSNNELGSMASIPPGISTISGRVICGREPRDMSKDNYGLYALKSDRSAAKKGLVLSIPLKKAKQRSDMVHEHYRPERTGSESSSLEASEGEEEVLRIEFTESEPEVLPPPPKVPPRRHKSRELISQEKAKQKNPSELFRIKKMAPKSEDSVDIFKKKTNDVFREFDQIFTNEPSIDSIPSISEKLSRKPHSLQQASSSISSSIEESYEEVKRKMLGNVRRVSSTITVQDFNSNMMMPRCKSIPSPNHRDQSSDSSFDAPPPPRPVSILKKPPLPKMMAPKQPETPKEPPKRPEIPKVPPKPPTKTKESPPNRKFFVYYNDQNDLVFNRNYTAKSDPQDALFKHYFTEHDSLRSQVSSEGIFIWIL